MTRTFVNDHVPHIFNIVTDPQKAGIVANMASSGGNISGVSHNISIKLQIKTALKVKNFKKLGIFYNPREQNTEIIKMSLNNLAKELDFEVIGFRAAPGSNLLEKHLKKLVNKTVLVDAVYLPLDSYIVSNANRI